MVRRIIEALIWLMLASYFARWAKDLPELPRLIAAIMAVSAILGFILILAGKMSFAGILEMWRDYVRFCPWCM